MSGVDALAQGIGDAFGGIGSALGLQVTAGLLATAFAWSGVMKLREPDGTALALVDFRITRTPRTGVARLVTWFEVGLGASLAVAGVSGSRAALIVTLAVASVTLMALAALLARAVQRGERFACMCFGDPADELSGRTVARTAVLGLIAVVGTAAAAGGGSAAVTGWREPVAGVIAGGGWLAVAALAGASRHLLSWNRDPFGLDADLNTRRLA